MLDLGDVTLLPGLIDAHVHLGFDASRDPVAQLQQDSDTTLLLRMRLAARQALAAGLTQRGAALITGGTDNHLVLLDVSGYGLTGLQAEPAANTGKLLQQILSDI